MPKKKPIPVEELIIPPQNGRIVGTICICQMTLVLSSVALVYLTVAIYVPSTRALKSGIVEDPVMCTTTKTILAESCDWGSCGEWCLSKTSGSCMQILVNLRHNGSSLTFVNCTTVITITCYALEETETSKYECMYDHCKNLTGTFNCTNGVCTNITTDFECIFKDTDPPLKCSGRRGKITCFTLEGLYTCKKGVCMKIRTPYNCYRKCVDYPTRNKNMIIISGDKVHLSQCQRAFDDDSGEEIWNESKEMILIVSCYEIWNSSKGIHAIDCVNGSLLANNVLGELTNNSYLHYAYLYGTIPLDERKKVAAPEVDLLIANESRLLINLEGCVNTLRDECKEFIRTYGKDGADHNAKARFPCFYAEDNPNVVVARFDLRTTTRQFLIAFLLPSVLFVVSCLTLILCQKTVIVGDDARMRFQGCTTAETEVEKSPSANNMTDRGGGNSIMAL